MEQIDAQETRRRELDQRHKRLEEEVIQTKSAQGEMDQQMEDYEERRKELRSEANSKRMVLVDQGSFTMGGREEDSPDNERPSHVATLSSTTWIFTR